MEWSKDKTMKLIRLLQLNPTLWCTSHCDTRREKQKRREELRSISDTLGITIPDVTKKIQHLRTQFNREWARQARAYVDDPTERYISNWYAFEYLTFLKEPNKPFSVVFTEEPSDILYGKSHDTECKLPNNSPAHIVCRIDSLPSVKAEASNPSAKTRDEFSVFGEYIANELRSLKGEKNLLVAKKKIQDVIFEVKMGMISEVKEDQPLCVFTHAPPGKLYTPPVMSTTAHIEPLTASNTAPTSSISEIIINGACHYSNFKVDTQ